MRHFGGLALVLFLALISVHAVAHERWILTPDQALRLNELPKPEIFTMFTMEGTFILLVFAVATGALLGLHYGATPKWLITISGQARRYPYFVPTILRFCAAWTLLSSAFGLEPQVGIDRMASPSFFAPDLIIADLGPGWGWLCHVQIILAVWLLVGTASQLAGLAIIALTTIGCALWSTAMLAYAPVWIGIGYYLLVRGGGRYALTLDIFRGFSERFPTIMFRYPQLVLRVCVGINLLYLGLYFKVLQPNLAWGVIVIYDVPVLSIMPETSVFLMAMVECWGGLLILTGIVIRLVSTALLFAFFFFAFFLPETFTAHMLLYGVMIAFLLLGPGRIRKQGRYSYAPVPVADVA